MQEFDNGNPQIRTFPTGLQVRERTEISPYHQTRVFTTYQETLKQPRVVRRITSQITNGQKVHESSTVDWYTRENTDSPFATWNLTRQSDISSSVLEICNPAYGKYSQNVATTIYREDKPARSVLTPIPYIEIEPPLLKTQEELFDTLRQRLNIHALDTIDAEAEPYASYRSQVESLVTYNLRMEGFSLDSPQVNQATEDANIMLDLILDRLYPEDIEKRDVSKRFLVAIGTLSHMMHYYLRQTVSQQSKGPELIHRDPFINFTHMALAETARFDAPHMLTHFAVCDFTDKDVKFAFLPANTEGELGELELYDSIFYGQELSLPGSPYAYRMDLLNGQIRITLVKGDVKIPQYTLSFPLTISQEAIDEVLKPEQDYTVFGEKAPVAVGNPMTGDMASTQF